MSRIILLDSGPLGLITNPSASEETVNAMVPDAQRPAAKPSTALAHANNLLALLIL
jgi:hypothetical protein